MSAPRPRRPGPAPLLFPTVGFTLGVGSPAGWMQPTALLLAIGLALLLAALRLPRRGRSAAVLAGWLLIGAARSGPVATAAPPRIDEAATWLLELGAPPLDDRAERRPGQLRVAWTGSGPTVRWTGRAEVVLAAAPGRLPAAAERGAVLLRGEVSEGRDGRLWLRPRRSSPVVLVRPGVGAPLRELVRGVRRRLRRALDRGTPVKARGLFGALVLGDRSGLTPQTQEAFARTGTAHLLAISGLHVGIAWLAVAGAARRLLAALGWGLRAGAPARAGGALAWLAAAAYVLVAGAPVSALRALGMLAAVVLARAMARRTAPWNALAIAALGVLVLDPGAARQLGFQLSVVSVAALVAWAALPERVEDRSTRWRRLVARGGRAVGLAVWTALLGTLATAPLVAATWGRIPIAGLWSNVVLMPLLGACTLAPLLAGAALGALHPSLGAPLLWLASLPASLGLDLVAWLAVPERAPCLLWSPSPGELLFAHLALALALALGRQR